MYFMQLAFFLGFAAAIKANNEAAANYDYYLCRLRVANVTKSVVRAIQDQDFDPQFEFTPAISSRQRTTFWLGVVPEEKDVEVMYEAVLPRNAKINAVTYPDLQSIKALLPDQFTFRCSNMTYVNTSGGISYNLETSYLVQLGGPQTSPSGRVRRPINLEAQTEVDCYVKKGYQPPFLLDEFPRYVANGEKFIESCSTVTKCINGMLGGVSRCPPFLIPPTMAIVRNVGECCDQSVTKADVEQKGCPKDERGSAFENGDNETYVPWQVRFQKKDGSLQCDGVIIEKNWFLTTQNCLKDINNIEFLRPRSIKYEPTLFRNVSIIDVKLVSDAKIDLALARIDLPFVTGDWTTQIQKVNLFWNQSACEKFVQKDCQLLVGTEQKDNINKSIVAARVIDREPTPLNDVIKRIKKQDNLPILRGSGLVGWFKKANFLAGIYIGNLKTGYDIHGHYSDDNDIGDLFSSCPFLDSIRRIVQKH